MAQIFLSYASEDRARVGPLVERLESEGWTVWWDRKIGGGAAWEQEIEMAIAAASCVVALWTRQSLTSDWVRNEARDGLERGILVPVVLDDVRPPLGFRHTQTIDLMGWPETVQDAAIPQLIDSVGALLEPKGQSISVVETEQTKTEARADLSVAVVPITNPQDPEADYLNEGIAEELILAFNEIDGIRVASRMASFGMRSHASESGLAERLKTSHLLTTTTRRAGERVRISAELTDADANHVWSQRFDGSLEDLFDLQDGITGEVSKALKVQLLPTSTTLSRRTQSPTAYNTYLLGLYEFNKRTKAGLERAAELFEEATRVDTNFRLAFQHLMSCYMNLWHLFGVPHEALVDRVKDAYTRQSHLWVGEFYDGNTIQDWIKRGGLKYRFEPLRQIDRAIEQILEPDHPYNEGDPVNGYQHIALHLRFFAMPAADLAVLDRIEQLGAPVQRGWIYLQLNRFAESIAACERDLQAAPGNHLVRHYLALAYARNGQIDDAERELERLKSAFGRLNLGGFLHLVWTEDPGAAGYYEQLATHPKVELRIKALGALLIGDYDRAFEFLESPGGARLGTQQLWMNLYAYASRTRTRAIEAEPRFTAWREKVGLGDDARKYLVERVNEISAVTGVTVALPR